MAHELYPGKYKPTITHSFIRLLNDKDMLMKLFTQNIDCLEREAGVPDEKIIEAHGSFARQRCIECQTLYPDDKMKKAVQSMEVPRCERAPECDGLVKPDIVFFGEQLPEAFHKNRYLPAVADLVIIIGTSLTVQPFASLPSLCEEGVPRVLINLERVGGLGSRSDDVLILGDCDAGVRKLADALGWREELEDLWRKTNPSAEEQSKQEQPEQTKDQRLESEIEQLTGDVDKTLQISRDHYGWLEKHLAARGKKQEADTAEEKAKIKAEIEAGKPASEKESGAETASSLEHVYPHLAKKPSL